MSIIVLIVINRYYKRKDDEEDERLKKEKQEEKEKEQKKTKERILKELKENVWKIFSVDLNHIHVSEVQDEVIRVVNSIAQETSVACVKQIKFQLGEKIGLYVRPDCDPTWFSPISWNQRADVLKKEWFNAKQLALQIIPNIGDKMPHFSQFEPLKSFNAEHILEKQTKKN